MLTDEAIREIILDERDLNKAAERLITAANNASGQDDVTVVLARIESA